MSMHIDGKKVTAMYWGGLKIREAWYEGRRVYSGRKPVEVMPATPGEYDARDWLRAKLEDYGENYQTVTEIPFEIDSSNATTMRAMFNGCSSLTRAPEMDTRNVTNMAYMFNACRALTSVPDMDTAQVTDAMRMFYLCRALTDGNVRLIGKHPRVYTNGMTTNSGLTRAPFYDSSGQPI